MAAPSSDRLIRRYTREIRLESSLITWVIDTLNTIESQIFKDLQPFMAGGVA